MAAYNTATGELVFTTYLEQNSFELSDALFTRNGEYVLFRTNDSNWCSGLTLDQCRATSTQQATVTITNLIEPEILPDAVVSNEILSVEQGEPAGLADLVETIIPETPLPVIISEDTSSLIEASETLPTDTNTFVPPTTEVLDILLPPS